MKTLITFFLLCSIATAGHLHPEKYYQGIWCTEQGGRTEVRMSDGTRCDCLTDDYAIEFDFAAKRYEAIGQAMHYSRLTGKPPGIVLIIEKITDYRYVHALIDDAECFGIPVRVWTMEAP